MCNLQIYKSETPCRLMMHMPTGSRINRGYVGKLSSCSCRKLLELYPGRHGIANVPCYLGEYADQPVSCSWLYKVDTSSTLDGYKCGEVEIEQDCAMLRTVERVG